MEYDKTNTFVIFVNDRKEPGSKQADRTGTLNVDGVEYFIDGWLGKTQAGATYLQGKIKRKDKQPNAPQQEQGGYRSSGGRPIPAAAQRQAPAGGSGFDDFDSDIPPF